MTMFQNLSRSMRYHDRLNVTCECGHQASFSQSEAIVLFGDHASPADIRQKLRCSRCHEIGKVSVWI